jgi:hypothetical protein
MLIVNKTYKGSSIIYGISFMEKQPHFNSFDKMGNSGDFPGLS